MGIHEKLPGVNWKIPLNSSNLDFFADVVEEEILEGRRLTFAGDLSLSSPGIVAASDPAAQDGTDTTQPLMLEVDPADPSRIYVYPGQAVTPSGHRIVITERQVVSVLSTTTLGAQTVIYAEYQNQETSPVPVLTRINDLNARREVVDEADLLKSALLDNYDSLDTSIKNRIVVLGVVTIQEIDAIGTLYPVIDLSQTNFAFNRPWFSVVDVAHRQMVGSGTPTVNNPHGLDGNDIMVAGDLSWYQAILGRGIILAPDESYPYVPGTACTETIPGTRFLTDTTGILTGVAGAKYVELIGYPIALGACVKIDGNEDTDAANLLAMRQVFNRSSGLLNTPGRSNIVYVNADEAIDPAATYELRYTCVKALEPPATYDSDPELTFGTPVGKETMITDGLAFNSISNPVLSTENLGPIPRRVWVLFDDENELIHIPQVLLPFSRLDDADADTFTISATPLGSGKIRVWLTDAIAGATLDVTLQLAGSDENGTAVTENITFGSSWSDNPAPATYENPNQAIVLDSIFAQLDTVTISNRTADGPNSAIVVEFVPEGVYENTDVDHALPVASIMWDGYRALYLTDEREVVINLLQAGRSKARDSGEAMLANYSIIALSGAVLNLSLAEDANQLWDSDQRLTRRWSTRGFKRAEDPVEPSANPKGGNSQYYSRAIRGITNAKWLMVSLLGDPYMLSGNGGAQFRYATVAAPNVWSSWQEFDWSPVAREGVYSNTSSRPVALIKYLPDLAAFAEGDAIQKFQVRVGGDWQSICVFQSDFNLPSTALGAVLAPALNTAFEVQHWGIGTTYPGYHKEMVVKPIGVGSAAGPGRLQIARRDGGGDAADALQLEILGQISAVDAVVFKVDFAGNTYIAGDTTSDGNWTLNSGNIVVSSGTISASGLVTASGLTFTSTQRVISYVSTAKLEEVIRTADALLTLDTFWVRASVNFGTGLDVSIALLDGTSAFLAVPIQEEVRNKSAIHSIALGFQHDGVGTNDFKITLQSAPFPGSGTVWSNVASATVALPAGSKQLAEFSMSDVVLGTDTAYYRLLLENDGTAEVGIYQIGLLFDSTSLGTMLNRFPS